MTVESEADGGGISSVLEDDYRRLFASNLIGVLRADTERVIEANDTFLHLTDYTREELEAGRLRWSALVPPEYAPLDEHGLAELMEYGECVPIEKEYRRKDGSRIPVLVRATLLGRTPLRWVSFVTDLSERRHLEQQARFQASVLDRTHDAIFLWKLRGPIVYWNRGAELLYGYHANEAVGRTSHVLLHTRLPETVADFEERLSREGEWRGELTQTTRDGHEIEVQSYLQVIREPDGTAIVFETAHDITEHKRLARELEERAATLGAVFAAMTDGLCVFDRQARIIHTNEALRILFALDEAAEETADFATSSPAQRARRMMAHRPDGSELSPEELPSARALHGDTALAREPVDIVATNLAGQELILSVSAAPLKDASGNLIGGIAVFRDVTERWRLEQELAKHAADLEEANRQLDNFLHVVVHELRQPLTNLKGSLQLAQQRMQRPSPAPSRGRRAARTPAAPSNSGISPSAAPIPAAHALLQRADQQADQLNRLLSDLADASVARRGRMEVRLAPFDLAARIRACAAEQRRALHRSIRLRMPAATSVMVNADAGRIEQVLTNYLNNAARYSPADSAIAVTLAVEDGHARVAVRDHGRGLTPEQQKRLWQRFARTSVRPPGSETDEDRAAKGGLGLGLGLYICRNLIEAHSGQVGVESTLGEGSAFWFALPLLPGEPSASTTK
jgi:PAS domain S-box-containing protein